MPADKISKSSPQPQRKKKKKKKKRSTTDSPLSPNTADQLHSAAAELPAPQPPLPKVKSSSKKETEKGKKSKKSNTGLLSLLSKCGTCPVENFLSQLSAQARESVRWEGALEDPLEEEQRLELYRDNRRQRYVKHREAQLKEVENKNKKEQ